MSTASNAVVDPDRAASAATPDPSAGAVGALERALSGALIWLSAAPIVATAVTAVTAGGLGRGAWVVAGVTGLVAVASVSAGLWLRQRLRARMADVTALAEGRSRRLQHIDSVTGRLNRVGLRRHLERLVSRGHRASVGVVMLDLERFRALNATLGRHHGDDLLREVARRIQAVLPQQAVARLSGDVFAAVVVPLTSEGAADALARNLLRALEPEVRIAQRDTRLTARFGIALASTDAVDGDAMLARAEAALRASKASGGAFYRVFDPSMLAPLTQRLELETMLRRAVEREAFTLEYQPIFDTDGCTIQAVEALLRCESIVRGGAEPARFVPLLEEIGLIVPVGQWVLREACRRAQGWIVRGARPFMLSVNVSPIQFAQADFVPQVLATLATTGWPARQLQLEVTEGLLLDPTPDLQARLDALAQAGVSLALDDFGMGYSSLAYLKRFRLRALKIDRMFVVDVPEVARDTAIVRGIVELAHALGLHVTVEGVETARQWSALSNLGCDTMQGFYFARPMSGPALLERLRAGHPARDAFAAATDWSTTMADGLDSELSR